MLYKSLVMFCAEAASLMLTTSLHCQVIHCDKVKAFLHCRESKIYIIMCHLQTMTKASFFWMVSNL